MSSQVGGCFAHSHCSGLSFHITVDSPQPLITFNYVINTLFSLFICTICLFLAANNIFVRLSMSRGREEDGDIEEREIEREQEEPSENVER